VNCIKGKIVAIKSEGSLSLVHLETELAAILTVIVIDTPATASYLEIGKEVQALFKETEVILDLAKKRTLSIENCIPGEVMDIEEGTLMSQVRLQTVLGTLTAVITTTALQSMAISEGKNIVALIKVNEIMLSE